MAETRPRCPLAHQLPQQDVPLNQERTPESFQDSEVVNLAQTHRRESTALPPANGDRRDRAVGERVMAEPERTSYRERVERHTRRSVENSVRWIGQQTADDLLAKLTTLHRQTEKHDELLSVYETLHESERRFREMIDALPAAIYTTDAEGRLTHFNPAAVRLSGRTPELGTDQWCVTWKLFWPDGTPMKHDECPMAVALREGRIQDGVEAIAERPDGARFWFAPYPRLLRDAEGRIVGGINMLLDITERKQAEQALRKSEERLREVAGRLDAEVRERTNELERQNGEMLEQAGHLRTLSNRLMRLQDDERRRIARELHDSVGQDLAALSMCLEGTKRSANGMPQAVARMLDDACAIVERCSCEIRTLSHLLHPPLLEELGLASAIQWYVEGFASRSKIEVDLQMSPGFKRLDSSVELPLFRVLQECLTNIHRHSESKTATVKVEADEHKVSLEVADRGKGIAQRDATLNVGKRMGVGISGMRERLNDLGGTLEIHSTNQGTTVRAAIPLRADARAATQ